MYGTLEADLRHDNSRRMMIDHILHEVDLECSLFGVWCRRICLDDRETRKCDRQCEKNAQEELCFFLNGHDLPFRGTILLLPFHDRTVHNYGRPLHTASSFHPQ